MLKQMIAQCRAKKASLLIFGQSQVVRAAARSRSWRNFNVSTNKHGESLGQGRYKTSTFDKKVLIWTRTFPNMSAVPNEVSEATMKKAKDKFRILVCILMSLAIFGFGVAYIQYRKF